MSALRAAMLRLANGDTTVTVIPHGNSMTPRIRSGQRVTVEFCATPEEIAVDDVVLCVVHGVTRLHLVTAVDHVRRRVQISNNHGHVNGWTGFSKIYGRVTKIG